MRTRRTSISSSGRNDDLGVRVEVAIPASKLRPPLGEDRLVVVCPLAAWADARSTRIRPLSRRADSRSCPSCPRCRLPASASRRDPSSGCCRRRHSSPSRDSGRSRAAALPESRVSGVERTRTGSSGPLPAAWSWESSVALAWKTARPAGCAPGEEAASPAGADPIRSAAASAAPEARERRRESSLPGDAPCTSGPRRR